MRLLPSFLLLCIPAIVPAQTLAELTDTLAKAETLDDEAIGDGGEKSATYRTYEQFRDLATREELITRLLHKSPIVRGYAARALADKKEKVDWLAVLRAHAADLQEVGTFRGCVKAQERFGEVLIDLARERKLLSDEQWLDLAETLVQQKSQLAARDGLLRTLKLRDGMLHTLRDLAKGGDRSAHIALARYGIQKDLPLLVDFLRSKDALQGNEALLAAQLHPDPTLLHVLEEIEPAVWKRVEAGSSTQMREWLAAIAAQQSEGAGTFLAGFLQRAGEAHPAAMREVLQHLKAALVPYPNCAALEPVREQLRKRARR